MSEAGEGIRNIPGTVSCMGLRAGRSSGPECILLGVEGECTRGGSSGMECMLLGVGGAEGEGLGEREVTPDNRLMTLSSSSSDTN